MRRGVLLALLLGEDGEKVSDFPAPTEGWRGGEGAQQYSTRTEAMDSVL